MDKIHDLKFLIVLTKELGNIKSRHWDLYAKPDASVGFNEKKLRFLRNLPLELHNFIIFLDKLYLKTDCNVIG